MNKRRHLPVSAVLLALLGLLVAVGCNPDTPQSIMEAQGPVARSQLRLFWIIFWLALVVFVLVGGWLLYTVIRFRRKPGQGIPAQVHGNTKLEIAWTIVPIVMLAILAVPTVATQFYISDPPEGDVLEINVKAHQWWWELEYPDSGVVTSNEIHVPVGKAVKVNLTSNDVLHSFWIPKLAGKLDIIPGKTLSMWFQADEVGEYFGQCAEFCGQSHAWMKFRVLADTPEDFEAWKQAQLTDSAQPTTDAETQGSTLFLSKACIACHTISGVPGAAGILGPNMTHVGSRTTLAAGIMDMNESNLREWIIDPEKIKPGNTMADEALAYINPDFALSSEDIDNLVAYILSLK